MATLAGISIDYLVRLEQGRDTRPSASVIAALADALRLDDDQHRQLSMLAMVSESAVLCPAAGSLTRVVAPTVKALLERLGTTPAFVVGPANDVLAWNRAWERLVRPLGMLENAEPSRPLRVPPPGCANGLPRLDRGGRRSGRSPTCRHCSLG